MPLVAVTKMHGARNDFILWDCRGRDEPGAPATIAREWCDRRSGIGADGLLVMLSSARADLRVRIFNPDGSEAEMCGNGMRCIARYVCEPGGPDQIRIETPAGIIHARIAAIEPEYLVQIDVGVPRLIERRLPFGADFVDVGNPHAVIFTDDATAFDLERAIADFPQMNVHAAQVLGRDALRVVHYERGAGKTQACGTGAAACAAAAIARGWCDSPVHVAVPGGRLSIEWDGRHAALLTGPAQRVFEAQIDVSDGLSG